MIVHTESLHRTAPTRIRTHARTHTHALPLAPQIAQMPKDSEDRLFLWSQALKVADCMFLRVYACTRPEDPERAGQLEGWVQTMVDVAAEGVAEIQADKVCVGNFLWLSLSCA